GGNISNNLTDLDTDASVFSIQPWIDSSFNPDLSGNPKALPLFLHKALNYGESSATEVLFPKNHGLIFSEYQLAGCQKFNGIQDDAYLLTRSFKLIQNIDF